MKQWIQCTLSALIMLFYVTRAHATLIAYDGFNYTPGSANLTGSTSLGGDSGLNSTWQPYVTGGTNADVTSGSLNYDPPLPTSGNSANLTTTGGVYRTLTNPISVAASSTQTVWLSVYMKNSVATTGATSGIFLYNSVAPASTTASVFSFGSFGGTANWRGAIGRSADNGTTAGSVISASSGIGSTTGELILMRLTIDTNAGNAELLEVWLNPNLSTFDPLAPPTTYLSGSYNAGLGGISSVGFYSSLASPNLAFDELRIGTTFADVSAVPEPSSFALVIGSLAGILATFKRLHRQDSV